MPPYGGEPVFRIILSFHDGESPAFRKLADFHEADPVFFGRLDVGIVEIGGDVEPFPERSKRMRSARSAAAMEKELLPGRRVHDAAPGTVTP
jgi:hypothetical protein